MEEKYYSKTISPLDGRYHSIGEELSPYFSEFALVKNRVRVEVLWLEFFITHFDNSSPVLKSAVEEMRWRRGHCPDFDIIYKSFDEEDFNEVKLIESETNHDVKSVEIFVARKLEELGCPELKSFVHIGCTSEDITNCAYANMMKEALSYVWGPTANDLITSLEKMFKENYGIPMLAHTHGQPATPTTVGKEFLVYIKRLNEIYSRITKVPILAKFNGATGNYSAIQCAFPDSGVWMEFAKEFVEDYLELTFNPITTQIESHDWIYEIFMDMAHFNLVVTNLCHDMWTYISMEYFKQLVVKKEVGSSTMPNKVNPINFENGEGNLRKSTSDLMFIATQLMDTRMQRDLRDSTVLRNMGMAVGYSILGIRSTIKGLSKVVVNKEVLERDLENRYEVLAEPIQTILRKYGVPDAYNKLKELTRGKNITKEALHEFLNSEELSVVPEKEREKLLEMRPSDYIGLANAISNHYKYEFMD